MGNAITRDYDLQNPEIGYSGLWKLYSASKKSNKKAATLFEKKNFKSSVGGLMSIASSSTSSSMGGGGGGGGEQEVILEIMKREASQLSRLRHPAILEVADALDDTKIAMAFATEPILCCLGNHLNSRSRNYSSSSSAVVGPDGSPFELDDLEIQKGLLQISSGLKFLHNDAKLVHNHLTPYAIYINEKGDWKIAGFGYHSPPKQPAKSVEIDNHIPISAQITYEFSAPESIIDGVCDFPCDIFSLGCLIYALYNQGAAPLKDIKSDFTFKSKLSDLARLDLKKVPSTLHALLTSCLQVSPDKRPSIAEFQSNSYFENVLVNTMRYLETLVERSTEERVRFLQNLPKLLPQYPDRLLKGKILSVLMEELKDHRMTAALLPNIFYIGEKLTQREFHDKIFERLRSVLTSKDLPNTGVVLIIENMELLLKKCLPASFKEDMIPFLYNSLDSKTTAIQEKALKVIPGLSEAMDYTSVKNYLFPKIEALYSATNLLSVKVNTLICFHALLKTLDRFTIFERLTPLLKQARTRHPAVIMATMVLYEEIGRKYADKEQIALEIIPELWKMCMDPSLNIMQFKKFMKVIKDLTEKVEDQHLSHLGELKQMEHSSNDPTPFYPKITSAPTASTTTTMGLREKGLDYKSTEATFSTIPSIIPPPPPPTTTSMNNPAVISSNPGFFNKPSPFTAPFTAPFIAAPISTTTNTSATSATTANYTSYIPQHGGGGTFNLLPTLSTTSSTFSSYNNNNNNNMHGSNTGNDMDTLSRSSIPSLISINMPKNHNVQQGGGGGKKADLNMFDPFS